MNTGNDGKVIWAVSESIKTLIRQQIPELSAEDAVVFESPGQIKAQGENKLSLFLYQILGNPYMKNAPPTINYHNAGHPNPASVTQTPAPYTVDLVYLVVVYAKSAELELILADKVVRVLHQFGELPRSVLNPVLLATQNTYLQIVPDHSSIDTLRNIWSSFPGNEYKLTNLYKVSPVSIPIPAHSEVNLVTSADMGVEKL